MSERTVTVESRVFGSAAEGEPLPSVRISVDGSQATPRELIAKAVAGQLDELEKRRLPASASGSDRQTGNIR